MIALKKASKPQILVDNEAKWTATIVTRRLIGSKPTDTEKTRYRHPQIKAALVAETHGKCAYCESKLLHIQHGDVEHIYPKSLDSALTFKWENLTLACEICNQNKSDKDPLLENIIDPYLVDPSEHLIFCGPLIFARGTSAGTATKVLLNLNRGELSERRREHLESVMSIVGNILREDLSVGVRRALFQDLVDRYAAESGPYSAMVRTVVVQVKSMLPPEVTI
jgi:hypothetical protein